MKLCLSQCRSNVAKGVREQGVEEDIGVQEGQGNRGVEKTT
jgi:hypothetical protein